eukprot:847680-Prymnesium_polylepis.2
MYPKLRHFPEDSCSALATTGAPDCVCFLHGVPVRCFSSDRRIRRKRLGLKNACIEWGRGYERTREGEQEKNTQHWAFPCGPPP